MLEYQHSIRKLVRSEIEVGKREFDFLASENERLTVFVCYHHAVREV